MITHFAELELHTISLIGVKQVYADRLGFPITAEAAGSVTFALTPHTVLKFVERYEPITPAHFAFEVQYSTFNESVEAIKKAGLVIAGDITWNDGMSLYFRDGDGHLLEIYTHDYIREGILPASHLLQVIYLREVGFPVEQMSAFRMWLETTLDMQRPPGSEAEDFSFVIGGTAHMVVVDKTRPWIPIAMQALPPRMSVAFGTPDSAFLERVRRKLQAKGALLSSQPDEIAFRQEGYSLSLRYTPQFSMDLPARLNLPLAILRLG